VKAVFDTNVLIAAFLAEGICAKLLTRARRRDFDLILCEDIFQEFKRVLQRKFSASPHEISYALAVISEAITQRIEVKKKISPVCRDQDDDQILACAREASADYIVTGDEDLLVLGQYEGVTIVKPREFELLWDN
jgi:putative PIN family toxin of toxin-antitoxin system